MSPSQGFDTAWRFDVATGKLLRVFHSNTSFGCKVLAISSDGKYLAGSTRFSKIVYLWDRATGKLLDEFYGPCSVYSAAFSPDGKYLASGGSDRTVRFWDLATGEQERVFDGQGPSVRGLAFSPDGKYLAAGNERTEVPLWDVATGRLFKVFKGHLGMIKSVAFSPDGQYLASWSNIGEVKLWKLDNLGDGQEEDPAL